ncbi:RIP metalloprotease RseP [Candidatus Falkowbacteria bacterium CG10_big_fil_rev_8_21_14_0_10_37_6]|uniref:Zinc metalloprotease n=1 Tax=Candidatus Falkowbacteria bacterium CG10_big_fil_rev_8_21_14_0_10_37_6 TaxID=1974563 RepID=A0A2H0V7L2_9BACT|nr:MAG: RIP metalloprotease RseP [Candidatus Falkowbacteria bacterium CG10_big_fil_rev_8_21_14_0_10_37_6]
MFTTIITFLIILAVLVFAHELGHFWTAKKLGLIPKEFGFGFPPRIGGFYKGTEGKWRWVWGTKRPSDAFGTLYSINWLPLGGFVNIGEDEEAGGDPKHFKNQKPWKRTIILSAGVVMNLLVAAVFISWGFMIGLPQTISGLPDGVQVRDKNIQVLQVLPNTPAESAGIQLGDIILSIDGQSFTNEDSLQEYIAGKQGQELKYLIRRGDQETSFNITLETISSTGEAGIGIAIAETGIVSYPFFRAIWEGIAATAGMTWYIIIAFAVLLKNLVMGAGVSADVSGPVGIAVMTGQVASLGFVYLLQFAAMLSINLAIINFLPFPALDGGRVLFVIIEKLRGRPVPEKIENALHNAGFILLIMLVFIVTYRDVLKFWH